MNQATIGAALDSVSGGSVPDIIGVGYYQSLTGDNAITGNIVVRQNNGDGTFGPPQNLEEPSAILPFSIAIGDFNGDGKPDIVAFNFTVSLFNLLFGNPELLYQIDTVGQGIAAFPTATAALLLNNTASSAFTNANSASFKAGGLASASIVSAFGSGLASATVAASVVPLPTTLGGTSITVIDSLGVSRPAPLFYASPTQINYEIPDGTAIGGSVISIATPDGIISVQQPIVGVAPGIFNVNGFAAANVFTYNNGAGPVVTSTLDTQGQIGPAPIDVGSGSMQVYLILYGTGIRNHQSPVTAIIGTVSTTAAYAGAQGVFVGEDQINVLLPQSLKGSGLVSVTLTADGETTNAAQIEIQ
jgi:uncharacterized protein (TIGR03437 family)